MNNLCLTRDGDVPTIAISGPDDALHQVVLVAGCSGGELHLHFRCRESVEAFAMAFERWRGGSLGGLIQCVALITSGSRGSSAIALEDLRRFFEDSNWHGTPGIFASAEGLRHWPDSVEKDQRVFFRAPMKAIHKSSGRVCSLYVHDDDVLMLRADGQILTPEEAAKG